MDEFTDGVVDEDPAQAVASLENELDGVFDVTEGQGSDGNNTNTATCEAVMSLSVIVRCISACAESFSHAHNMSLFYSGIYS